MNAFYEHHQNSIGFGYRCFDRILLNGLIQPFIKPLLAAAQQHRRSRRPQNPSPLEIHYQTIRASMRGVFYELGIAA